MKARNILCQDQAEAASVEAAQEEAEASVEEAVAADLAVAEALAEVITAIITIITDPFSLGVGAQDTTEADVSAVFWV